MIGQRTFPSSPSPQTGTPEKQERDPFLGLIPDLACIIRFDGYFAEINDCWETTLGFTRAELLSRPLTDFIHPDDLQLSRKAMEQLASGQPVATFENRYRTRHDAYRWLQWRSVANVEEKLAYAVARDVTLEKQRSHAAADLAAFDCLPGEASQDCITVLDANGCLVSMNSIGQQLLAISDMQAVLGKSWYAFLPQEQARMARTAVAGALAGQSSRLTHFCATASGRHGWWDVLVSPVVGEDGKIERVLAVSRDVTAQRKSEDMLRRSEAHFQALMELSGQIVWMTNADGAMTSANSHWYALTGMTEAQTLGGGWMKAIAVDYRENAGLAWRQAHADDGRPFEIELPLVRADGEIRRHLYKGTPLRDEDGRITEWVGVAFDIDVNRQAQEGSGNAAERFRFLAESAPQKVFTARADGEVDYCNRQWMDYIGLPLGSLSGSAWLDIVHPQDREANRRRWREAVDSGEPYQFEHRLRRFDGAYHWHLTRAHATRDSAGSIVMWVGTTTDIHDMKHAQEAMRMSEMRYRSLAASSAGIVWSCSQERDIAEPIPSWENYTGQQFDDYCGKGWMNAIHPDDIDDLEATWHDAVRNLRLLEKRCRIRRHDGCWRLNLMRGVPVLNALGDVLEWVGTAVDIHDRSHAQRQLEDAIASERAARAEAERIGRVKDEFLTTLSHELRTPLNAIFGWSQILKRKADDVAAVTRGIDVIDRNVRMQTRLIEDLLDISSIISGKIRLDLQPVRLDSILTNVIESVLPSAAAKSIDIEHAFDPIDGVAHGDTGRLQQVFWNLLTNAIKFTPHDGRVSIALKQVDDCAEISVVDTGEGIAPDFLPHLFERFSQADASIRRRHGGLGIGLSIVRSLVAMHGGVVRATSAGVGKGSRFTVSLPLEMRQAPGRSPNDGDAAYGGRTRSIPRFNGVRVLIVDDEADARELARQLLEECGAVTRQVASASDARDALKTFQPQLILCDLGMPVEDGYTFMQALRQHDKVTPAAALTAFARGEDRARSLKAGFQMHLTKPIEPADLFNAVALLTGSD